MNKPTNLLARLGALLLLLLFMGSTTAMAQTFFVAPGANGSGASAADPGRLSAAIAAVNAGPTTEISFASGNYIAGSDAPNSFAIEKDVTFSATGYVSGPAREATLVGFNIIQLGEVEPDTADPFDDTKIDVTLANGFNLELRGVAEVRFAFTDPNLDGNDPTNDEPTQILSGGAVGGQLIISTNGRTNLAVDSAPGRAVVQRLRVENGTVMVQDNQLEQFIGDIPASLHVFEQLAVVDGATLDLDTQNLYLTYDLEDPLAWEVAANSAITSNNGSIFFVLVDTILGTDDTFTTTGTGTINANLIFPYSEAQDPGMNNYSVFITFSSFGITASTIGGPFDMDADTDGDEVGDASATEAFTFQGTGKAVTDDNTVPAWDPKVQFTNLTSVEGDLVLDGAATPGLDTDGSTNIFTNAEDVDDDGTAINLLQDGVLTGRLIHNQGAVNLLGDWFFQDEATLRAGTMRLDQVGTDTGSATFEDLVTAEANGSGGTDYIFLLDGQNLTFLGDLDFFASPITGFNTNLSVLPVDPRIDYERYDAGVCPAPGVAPVNNGGITGQDGINVPYGVILSGEDDQFIFMGTDWVARHVQALLGGGADLELDVDSPGYLILAGIGNSPAGKAAADSDTEARIVEALADGVAVPDPDASSFVRIEATRFTSNGRLDANGTAQVTVVWTADGRGTLLAGESDQAYRSNLSSNTPVRIRYEGTIPIFTGDEIPGDASGRADIDGDGDEEIVRLETMQVAMATASPTVTIGKDVIVEENLDLPRGQLAVGSASVYLNNFLLLSIGDGNIVPSAGFPINGRLVFPNMDEAMEAGTFPADGSFTPSIDGIDLYLYPSLDRIVMLEYPGSDQEVIRDFTVNAATSGTTVSLRDVDDEDPQFPDDDGLFRVNRDVCIDVGIFDIIDNTYRVSALNGIATTVYVDLDGDIVDDFWPDGVVSGGKATVRNRAASAAFKSGTFGSDNVLAKASVNELLTSLDSWSSKSVDGLDKAFQDDPLAEFGVMEYTGSDWTDVVVETDDDDRLIRQLPAQDVRRATAPTTSGSERTVTYGALFNNLLDSGDTLTPLDELQIPRLRIFDAGGNTTSGTSPTAENGLGVIVYTTLDILNIFGDFYQEGGEFAMAVPGGGISLTKTAGEDFPVGTSDYLPADEGFWFQRVEVGFNDVPTTLAGDFHVTEAGNLNSEWYGNGGDLYVNNLSLIGNMDASSTVYWDGSPYTWHFSFGDFYVGTDEQETDGLYLGPPCRTSRDQFANCDADQNANTPAVRNVYRQGGFSSFEDGFGGPAVLWAYSDYSFFGTGDRFEDAFVDGDEQGLDGLVAFVGNVLQSVTQLQDEDAMFNKVLIDGDPGIVISDPDTNTDDDHNMWVNYDGTVNLQVGNINAPEGALPGGTPEVELVVLNPLYETGFVGRNSAINQFVTGFGDGARDSYVAQNTPIRRVIDAQETSGGTGGDVTDAYYFPHGLFRDAIPGLDQGREFFLPLFLDFNQDQGEGDYAKSTILQVDGDMANAARETFESTRVDAAGRLFASEGEVVQGGLTLNAISPVLYRVEFFGNPDPDGDSNTNGFTENAVRDEALDNPGPNTDIPSEDPNIRISADGVSFSDVKRVRIVHWSCDNDEIEFLGLAGVYDLFRDDVDDTSVNNNDVINGIMNLIQEGVNVRQCNIFGIAANAFENPVDSPLGSGAANERSARVQLIHDSPDAPEVDVYVDGEWVATLEFDNDGDATPKATGFGTVQAGERLIEIRPAGADPTSDPVVSTTYNFAAQTNYVILASGLLADNSLTATVLPNARLAAEDQGSIDAWFVHNAPNAPSSVDIRTLDPFNNNLPNRILANNLNYLQATGYTSLAPGTYSIEVTTSDNVTVAGVYLFNLNGYGGEALTCFASNTDLASKQDALAVLCADVSGNIIEPDVITDTEGAEDLPVEFALDGNYPNPFNPSTTIQFDLPETAEVSVEVIDMLGRRVMTLPAQTVQAGADRTFQVDATNLASGVYLYRLIIKSANGTPEFHTGRMTLVK